MKARILFIVFIALGLVHSSECDVISNFIHELKEWSDYFGLTEDSYLWKTYVNEENDEESFKTHLLSEEGETNNLDTEKQTTIDKGNSKLPKEIFRDKKYEESSDHKEMNDLFVKTDKSTANEKLDQGVSSNLENVKVNSVVQDDLEQNENVQSATSIEILNVFQNTSEKENEILLYEDMVEIEFEEQEPNMQVETLETDEYIKNPGKNNANDHNTFLNQAASDKSIQNVMSKDGNEDFFDPLSQTENSISSSEENQIPGASILRRSFIEPPIAEDEDTINTPSLFSKCAGNNADDSLSCMKKDSLDKEGESLDEYQTIDDIHTQNVKTSTEDESHFDVCSLCLENIPPTNKWDSSEIQYESNEIERQ